MHEVIIRPEAELDIAKAYCWYEDQKPGLGLEFNMALDANITAIARHPGAVQIIYLEVRRSLLRRFPYGVFYVQRDGKVIVLALFHVRRDPISWPEAAERAILE